MGKRTSMRRRLLLGQLLVVAAGLVSAASVAYIVGPALFHRHLLEAGHVFDQAAQTHIEQAYRSANTVSLGAALVFSMLVAMAVTWLGARQLIRPLHDLTILASRVSDGDFSARTDTSQPVNEVATVADAFNHMAQRLENTEQNRRHLITDVAHEMRTPLAVLRAHGEALDDGLAAWDENTSRTFSNQVERLTRLADDMMLVSRAEEGQLPMQLEPMCVTDLVESAAAAARPVMAAKNIDLSLKRSPRPVQVLGDFQRLSQVLSNLLGNAARHTPSGGHITVAVTHRTRTVTIRVKDDGEGISADHLPHIFERFYRGDAARSQSDSGTGVGLAIARGIAHAHHGTLTAQSEGPGRGAMFDLTLPVHDAA